MPPLPGRLPAAAAGLSLTTLLLGGAIPSGLGQAAAQEQPRSPLAARSSGPRAAGPGRQGGVAPGGRNTTEASAGQPVAAPAASDAATGGTEPQTRFLLIRSDQQQIDVPQGRLVASGRVEAVFDGWRLLADRVEVMQATRTVYATGKLRLTKGDQTLQASRLRYSELEGTGELEDVYGVIDQEVVERELALLPGAQPPKTAAAPGASQSQAPVQPTVAAPAGERSAAAEPGFACPELVSDPRQRPLLELLPPKRVPVPTMPAPRGCPGAPGDDPRTAALRQHLRDAAIAVGGPSAATAGTATAGAAANPTPTSADRPDAAGTIDQRVENVRFRQSLDTSIKLDLAAVIDTEDSEGSGKSGAAGIYRRPRPNTGQLNRLRFQASQLQVRGQRWSAPVVAFTNDPFTPARSWTIGHRVEAVVDGEGVTRIRAARTRILLSNKLSLPGLRAATIGEEGLQFTLDTDQRDRDGIYVGYNLPTLRLGEKGKLELQPQVMVQRAIEGRTNSYTAPGKNLAGPRVSQDLQAGDLLGLAAVLDAPLGRFRLKSDSSLSTFSPDNFVAGTRNITKLSTPLPLPGHSEASAQLFGSYRERVYNGSLGLQTVVYSYGGQADGRLNLNPDPADPADDKRRLPYFGPFTIDWRAVSGNYQAALFETDDLDTQWRTRFNANVAGSLRLWQASLDPERFSASALHYSAVPIRPGLALDFGLAGSSAFYQEGAEQNTLTVYGGPSFTLGRFRSPWFDFTQVALLVGNTFRDGASPFGFDRAVDLRTVSFRAAQQLYGPLVLEAGATVNIDDRSDLYGDVSYSYVELKLQQRSYELGVYYSPYDGIGGIRVKLNDFSFGGSGTPFVPRPVEGGEPLSERR